MRIGVLGLGSIGKRHADNARLLGHDVMTYDINQSSMWLNRDKVLYDSDAIIIATPTPQHWEDILDCVDYGKPILIEKPIIHPDQKVLDIVADKLATFGVPAFMGFNLRFHSVVRQVKEWLPRIGNPIVGRFVVLQKNERYKDGVISNWMSHEIDLALHFLGPARVAGCQVDKDDTKALVVLTHNTCESGIKGNYLNDPEIRSFGIVGKHGQIVANLAPTRSAHLFIDGKRVAGYYPTDTFDENYNDELSSWIGQIQGRAGLCATWQDGVAAERIVIAARELGGLT